MLMVRSGLGAPPRGGGEFEVKPGGGWTPLPIGPPGWNRFGIEEVTKQLGRRWLQRRDAMRSMLLATGQLKPCGDTMGARARPFCDKEARTGGLRMLDPIGVIIELGVPFLPDELLKKTLEKTYTPNEEQRFLADLTIYVASQIGLTSYLDDKLISYDLESSWILFQDVHNRLIGDLQRIVDRSTWSILGFINHIKGLAKHGRTPADYVTHVPDYSLNPIAPTEAELTGHGGLRAYYKRGGFLINARLARGESPCAEGFPTWNTGYCLCAPNGPAATYDSTPIASGVIWQTFVTVGPLYKLRMVPKDPSKFQRTISLIAKGMKELAGFVCDNRTTLQQLNTNLLAEVCHDVNIKPCTKGTQGCYCTPPTSTQQAAVGVANAGLSVWCTYFEPKINPPQTPFNPPPPPIAGPPAWMKFVPWILGGLAAGAGGAFVLARR